MYTIRMTEYNDGLCSFSSVIPLYPRSGDRMEHNRSNCKPRKRFRASLQFLRRLQPVASTLVRGARGRCQMGPAGTHASARVRLFKPPDPCLTFACR